jgi:hypothetical protein
MTLKEKLKDPKVLMVIGMFALVAANVLRYAFRGAASDQVPDFVMGIVYGVGIGTLMLSVIRRKRMSR